MPVNSRVCGGNLRRAGRSVPVRTREDPAWDCPGGALWRVAGPARAGAITPKLTSSRGLGVTVLPCQ
jgi:hypothetical protein